MKTKIFKHLMIVLFTLLLNFVVIIPAISVIIMYNDFYGLYSIYWGYVNGLTLTMFIVFIAILVILFMIKKIKFVKMILMYLGILIFIILLEHPKLLNTDFLYRKPMYLKFSFSKMQIHNSMSFNDKFEIYKSIIDYYSPCVIIDSLSNNAYGLDDLNAFKISFADSIIHQLENEWDKSGKTNLMVSERSTALDSNYCVISGYNGILTLSPIKKVDNQLIVGYTFYKGLLNAKGGFYKIFKEEKQWHFEEIGESWVS